MPSENYKQFTFIGIIFFSNLTNICTKPIQDDFFAITITSFFKIHRFHLTLYYLTLTAKQAVNQGLGFLFNILIFQHKMR